MFSVYVSVHVHVSVYMLSPSYFLSVYLGLHSLNHTVSTKEKNPQKSTSTYVPLVGHTVLFRSTRQRERIKGSFICRKQPNEAKESIREIK